MAVCLIANRRDGLSMNIVLKVGLLGFACNFRVYFRASSLRAILVKVFHLVMSEGFDSF